MQNKLMFHSFVLTLINSLYLTDCCVFPDLWWGTWYQPNAGSLTIHADSFSTKGNCFAQHRQFYLLINKSSSCKICILFDSLKHNNILKYKESNCLNESFDALCSDLANSNLYMLVRENSIETACPLIGFGRVHYRNQSHVDCTYPTSWLHQCSDQHSRFHLRLRHCSNVTNTRNIDLFMECIAKWKEGEDHYFYAKVINLENKDSINEEQYKCFLYQLDDKNERLHLQMSDDETCQDLTFTLTFPSHSQFSMLLLSHENGSQKNTNCSLLAMNYRQIITPKKAKFNSINYSQPSTALSSSSQKLLPMPHNNSNTSNKYTQNHSKAFRVYKSHHLYCKILNIMSLTLYILIIIYCV